jgi:hypothetical protein
MRANLALSTRIGVAILISLTLVTAAVTAFVVANPKPAVSNMTAPATSTSSATPDAGSSSIYLQDYLAAAGSSVNSAPIERGLVDLLPNHLFSINGGDPEPLASGIVVGVVRSVSDGVALSAQDGSEIPFDSSDAAAYVLVLNIAVEYGLGSASGDTMIRVGIKVTNPVDVEQLSRGLVEVGRILVVLDEPGDFDFNTNLYSVRRSGTMLATVAEDGTLTFPALSETESDFVGTLTTIDEVLAEAARTVPVGTVDNAVITSDP